MIESPVLVAQPRQFLGEHRHALAPGARHLRYIRPPEHAVGPECIVDLSQIGVHLRERIRLARITRRAGCLDRHIGKLRQRQKGRYVGHGRGIFQRGQAASATQVIDRQSKSRVALGNAAEFSQRIRRQDRDGNAVFFSLRPKPVEGTFGQPLARRIAQEPIPQTEHTRLLSPARDACTRVRLIERHRTHDREPAWIIPHRRKSHVGRAWIPTWRMNDGGIDAAFVHQDNGLLRGEVRDLPMRQVAWQAGSPQVNLGVDDLHRKSPIFACRRCRGSHGAMG